MTHDNNSFHVCEKERERESQNGVGEGENEHGFHSPPELSGFQQAGGCKPSQTD